MRADKQQSLLDGALRVFARDGYARASIDALAAEAGVSTRTIYNHYGDKAALFRAVILDSARRTAAHQIDLADRLLARIVDLEADLVTFGRRWARPDPETAPHFALVRQIRADADHIPDDTLRAWQAAGPLQVRAAIGAHLRRHADNGLLHIDDEQIAALHLIQLTAGSVTDMTDPEEIDRTIRTGVRVFVRAYAGTSLRSTHRGPSRRAPPGSGG